MIASKSKLMVILLLVLPTLAAHGEVKPTAEAIEFFEKKVRPILANRCFKCHGDVKQKGSLRVDSLAGMLKGGDTDPAIVPGHPEKSLLISAVTYADENLEMPPKKKLTDSEIEVLKKWVKIGALWPGTDADALRGASQRVTDEDRAYWFYQPLKRPVAPKLKSPSNQHRVANSVDAFILAKLEAKGLSIGPEADRVTLIRRVTYDLTGLPPTPAEIGAFVKDTSEGAYEKVLDRLLTSPRYGERWGRHWLDLVRYADSDGYKADHYRPLIWRYRNWVIDAFNEDMPYDKFVQYQLAGDELDNGDSDALVATGYLRLWPYEYNQRDVRTQWAHIIDDITDVSGKVFLGMSVGCARCHDHKFDPILRDDYFKLQAFFGTIQPDDELTAATPAQRAAYNAKYLKWAEATKAIRAKIETIEAPHRKATEGRAYKLFSGDMRKLLDTPMEQLSPIDQQAKSLAYRQLEDEHSKTAARIKGDEKKKWDALKAELAKFDKLRPEPLTPVMAVRDIGPVAPKTKIPGDRKNRVIAPGYPTVLDPPTPTIIRPKHNSKTTGRRLALAKWITNPENQLTTRVIVNRVWQHHFGRAIVATPNDFGKLGDKPTHPQLLDWLATEFVRQGWSFKQLHKVILSSSTYRQGSLHEPTSVAREVDPSNHLLWRQRVRRIEAEALRDAFLATSHELSEKSANAGISEGSTQRSVYLKIMRNNRPSLIDAFDGPDGFNSFALRSETTTAPQSLMLMNGDWVLGRAGKMANHVSKQAGGDPQKAVQAAYLAAFGRDARQDEVAAALAFFDAQRKHVKASAAALAKTERRDDEAIAKVLAKTIGSQHAAHVDVRKRQQLSTEATDAFKLDEFTIEAVVYLESLAKDASVRVIASHWNSNTKSRGWSFGVTSERSRYQPRNLILQFVGDTAKSKTPTYEVIASNLRPELNRVYHLAASVKLSDTSKAGVTFYMRDLTNDSKVQTATVAHTVTANMFNASPFIIGGRDKAVTQGWHGLLDQVRLYNKVLPFEALAKPHPRPFVQGNKSEMIGEWRFEGEQWLKDSSGRNHDLLNHGAQSWSGQHSDQHPGLHPGQSLPSGEMVSRELLVDFCHVLLNASEFMYVD